MNEQSKLVVLTQISTIEDLLSPIMANIMESDRIICQDCLERHWDDVHPYNQDNDPNWWLSSARPWDKGDECDCCGTKTGVCVEEPEEDSGDESLQGSYDCSQPNP